MRIFYISIMELHGSFFDRKSFKKIYELVFDVRDFKQVGVETGDK